MSQAVSNPPVVPKASSSVSAPPVANNGARAMPEAVHAAYNFPASQLNGNTPALPKSSSSVSPPPVADSSGYTQPGTSPGVGYAIVGQTSIDRYAQQENGTDGYNLPAPQQETKGDGYNLPAAQSAI